MIEKKNMSRSASTKMYVVVCVFTSVIFALIVSFHDYLPVHPPSYVLLAEDKLKPQYTPGHMLKAKWIAKVYSFLNIYATCDSAQAVPDSYASSICIIIKGTNQNSKGFLSLSTDLSPPAA